MSSMTFSRKRGLPVLLHRQRPAGVSGGAQGYITWPQGLLPCPNHCSNREHLVIAHVWFHDVSHGTLLVGLSSSHLLGCQVCSVLPQTELS